MNNNLIIYYKYRSEQRKFLRRSRDEILPNRKKGVLHPGRLATLALIVVIMAVGLSAALAAAVVFHCQWFAWLGALTFLTALLIVVVSFLEDQY